MINCNLPALSIADRVNNILHTHNTLVITAPPGAGKSTLLPLTMLEAIDRGIINGDSSQKGKILVLEPRRLAAKQIAERMAFLLDEKVGQTIGYRVRQDKCIGQHTRIEVITEGILSRMLISNPTLEGVDVVVFDEFHERSIHSDLALALCRQSQQIVRQDLRIVIMSATIDTKKICDSLSAPLVECEGRMFPVEVQNITSEIPNDADIALEVARVATKSHREDFGDILIFLPGEAEIRRCVEYLKEIPENYPDTTIHPLYAMLSSKEQREAIAPSRDGKRKIVIATSIAETSITIEGVRVVIDSGLCRRMVFDARCGLSHLETSRISLDMANQRSGRAGRVAPGRCYRLWTKAAELRMEECRRPEILDADPSPMLLDISAWGENNVENLFWISPPPLPHVNQGYALLQLLKAVDSEHKITRHGQALWKHPYHPRIAQMLVNAEKTGLQKTAIRIAEILEAPPSSWPKHLNDNNAGRLLAYAYPERIAMRQCDGIGQFKLANGNIATVDSSDPLSAEKWIVIASMNATGNGRVFLAAALSAQDLDNHINEFDNITWDNKQGCCIAQRERRIGTILIDSHTIQENNRELIVKTICDAAPKYGTSMFDFSDAVANLQRRISTVNCWHPELKLPNISTEEILKKASQWLPFYIGKATSANELKKIEITTVIWSLLTYDQQQAVDRIAPSILYLPNGRRLKVEYRAGAELPIVRIKLQDCFGVAETPRLDEGRRPVLMELLSPGFKPVQLTQDLHSFWNETYFEVRKELRRRYPKHAWPEDPFSIQ